jgi:ribosomal protein L11 methyltransferase
VTVPHERAETARAQMLELFPHGFEELDSPGGVELIGYTDAAGEEHFMHEFSGASSIKLESSEVAPGWEERWRQFHRPARIGPLWVGPPWEEPPPDALAVVIDPGRAFGTGSHATTRLCLEHLLELRDERRSLVDVGCGSGVLAIAAARIGFDPVIALDNDPAAIAATRTNAAANGVAVETLLGDALAGGLPDGDVVVANISLEAIVELGAGLHSRVVVTAGYLVSERPQLPGYIVVSRREGEGWAADLHTRVGR